MTSFYEMCIRLALRLLLIASLLCALSFLSGEVNYGYMDRRWSLLPAFIIIHHGLSVRKHKFLSFLLDFVLVCLELAILFDGTRYFSFIAPQPWSTAWYTVMYLSWMTTCVTLSALCICRLIVIIHILVTSFRAGGQVSLLSPFDILYLPTISIPRHNDRQMFGTFRRWWSKVKIPAIFSFQTTGELRRSEIIFGKWLLEQYLPGEAPLLIISRGVIAIMLFFVVIIFFLLVVIIQPLEETGLIPTKQSYAVITPAGTSAENVSWTVVAMINKHTSLLHTAEDLHAAISVEPLWSPYIFGATPCNYSGHEVFRDQPHQVEMIANPSFETITYSCPPCIADLNLNDFITSDIDCTVPDLFITVNFTALGYDSANASIVSNRLNVVTFAVGFTSNVNDIMTTVHMPAAVAPGMNVLGSVSVHFRSLFEEPSLASFGLYASSRMMLAAQIYNLLPDPSPLIVRRNDTATLRLYVPADWSDWLFVSDYREKTVLAGFASVGGIWTFLSAIFSFLFGSALGLVFFGLKPISIFGACHKGTVVDRKNFLSTEPELQAVVQCLLQRNIIDLSAFETTLDEHAYELCDASGVGVPVSNDTVPVSNDTVPVSNDTRPM